MKLKPLLFAVGILSLSTIGATPVELILTVKADPIGPFAVFNEDYTFNLKIMTNKTVSNVTERLSLGEQGQDLTYFYTTAAHSISTRRSASVNFTLPLSEMLSINGIYGKIEIMVNGNVKYSYPFNLKPTTSHGINVRNYHDDYYVIEDEVIQVLDYENCHTEEFGFYGFIDYFKVNNYYRLDIHNLYIDYYCFKDFPGGEAYLHFTDYNGVFSLMDSYDPLVPMFDVPLRFLWEPPEIYFLFPETMYVDPTTLQMSLTAKPGLVATHYFYLPRNKLSLLLDQDFYLEVKHLGHSNSYFSWKIRYLTNRNLIGDCDNSDYCVVGEVE